MNFRFRFRSTLFVKRQTLVENMCLKSNLKSKAILISEGLR